MGNKQVKHYVMLNENDVCDHDKSKHGGLYSHNCEGRTLVSADFKQLHGSRWKTVAHRMRTWYAAKFKQANKDKDAATAYRMLDNHNAMLSMIQAG